MGGRTMDNKKAAEAANEDNAKVIKICDNSNDAINNIAYELSKGTVSEPMQDPYEIDLAIDYGEPNFTLIQESTLVGTLARGDLHYIKGKAKSCKSFLCTIFAASLLGDKSFGFSSTLKDPLVLYFDTEQNKRHSAKMARRIHSMLGWDISKNNSHLKMYSMRTAGIEERKEYILASIQRMRPQVVFIDGLLDLMTDFNDNVKSQELIETFLKLSADIDCAIVNVVHENPGRDKDKMKGSAGSLAVQKGGTVFEVKKENPRYKVEVTDSRDKPLDGFSFVIDGHGIPHLDTSLAQTREDDKTRRLRELMQVCFADDKELAYTEIVLRIMQHSCKCDRTAKNYIEEAKLKGILKVAPNTSKYTLI